MWRKIIIWQVHILSTGGDALSNKVLSTLSLSLSLSLSPCNKLCQIMSASMLGCKKFDLTTPAHPTNSSFVFLSFFYSVWVFQLIVRPIVHTTHVCAHVRNVYNWLFFESRLLDMDNDIHEMYLFLSWWVTSVACACWAQIITNFFLPFFGGYFVI